METAKANSRRAREGFFDRFLQGRGIDIGCGTDKVLPDADGWDLSTGQGDATAMLGVKDWTYDWVYSSHCLEHLADPVTAVRNWWRILKPGGFLIIVVPHRDLYEKKRALPSRWNEDHKHFFVIDRNERPCTIGLLQMVDCALPDRKFETVWLRKCDDGRTITDSLIHSDGEFSIELVLRKT